jgi:hypothetical protein
VHILPWPPSGGKPDQVSPIRAADPSNHRLAVLYEPFRRPEPTRVERTALAACHGTGTLAAARKSLLK